MPLPMKTRSISSRRRARVEEEHTRAADMAAALAVPAQRPRRGAAVMAANAAMDTLHARGGL